MLRSPLAITKELRAYLFLLSLVVCGLVASLITAPKVVAIGNFNFTVSVVIFSIFTYPMVDCICELWGQSAARQALWIGLFCQLLFMALLQISIVIPPAPFWTMQGAYAEALSMGFKVAIASLIAFGISQILDVFVYQRIKEVTRGKKLWLRSNISIYLGQALDSLIFVNIIFYDLPEKWHILFGSLLVKAIVSFMMTPVVYIIIHTVNRYLDFKTLAFMSGNANSAPLRANSQ